MSEEKSEKSLWGQYCQMQNKQRDEWRKCSVFIARHRLARIFKGIEIDPNSKVTAELLRGYSAGMRLFLAYNALELAADFYADKENEKEKAAWYDAMAIVGEEKKLQELRDKLRAFLGENTESENKNSKGKVTAKKMVKSLKYSKYFTDFLKGEKNDLAIFARSVRHMFAHGDFTASGNDVLKAEHVKLFDELADVLLKKSRAMFDEYLKKVLENQK